MLIEGARYSIGQDSSEWSLIGIRCLACSTHLVKSPFDIIIRVLKEVVLNVLLTREEEPICSMMLCF